MADNSLLQLLIDRPLLAESGRYLTSASSHFQPFANQPEAAVGKGLFSTSTQTGYYLPPLL
jgi:hypothetical protein